MKVLKQMAVKNFSECSITSNLRSAHQREIAKNSSEGVTYNREKGAFLTSKINALFAPIASLNSITGGDKEKQDGINAVLSNWVGTTGRISNLFIRDLKALAELCPKIAKNRKNRSNRTNFQTIK